MADRVLPRHREAFPKLDVVAVKAALDNLHAPVCIFTEGHKVVGQLFVVCVNENSILFNYIFALPYAASDEQQVSIEISKTPSPLDDERAAFLCPSCGTKKWILYFGSRWVCADCLGLLYRSQLIGKETKLWELRSSLEERVGRGRPKGMHNATYHRLLRELTRVRVKLHGQTRKYASEAHNIIVREKWHPSAEVELWSARYAVRGGNFIKLASTS